MPAMLRGGQRIRREVMTGRSSGSARLGRDVSDASAPRSSRVEYVACGGDPPEQPAVDGSVNTAQPPHRPHRTGADAPTSAPVTSSHVRRAPGTPAYEPPHRHRRTTNRSPRRSRHDPTRRLLGLATAVNINTDPGRVKAFSRSGRRSARRLAGDTFRSGAVRRDRRPTSRAPSARTATPSPASGCGRKRLPVDRDQSPAVGGARQGPDPACRPRPVHRAGGAGPARCRWRCPAPAPPAAQRGRCATLPPLPRSLVGSPKRACPMLARIGPGPPTAAAGGVRGWSPAGPRKAVHRGAAP